MQVRLVSTFVLALAACGCGGAPAAPSAPAAVVDAVTGVTNMAPAPNTTLAAGQTVTFSGTPAYSLYSADLGTVQIKRGRLDLLGKRFDVESGSSVRFTGPPDRPTLDVKADYEARTAAEQRGLVSEP